MNLMITWHAYGISFRYCIKIFSLTISATKNLSGCSLTISCKLRNNISIRASIAHERNKYAAEITRGILKFLLYPKLLIACYGDSRGDLHYAIPTHVVKSIYRAIRNSTQPHTICDTGTILMAWFLQWCISSHICHAIWGIADPHNIIWYISSEMLSFSSSYSTGTIMVIMQV